MGFKQTGFLKTRYFRPYARQIFIAVRQKIQCMLEKLRAYQMVKKSSALRVSSSQRVSFCPSSIHLKLRLSRQINLTSTYNPYFSTIYFYITLFPLREIKIVTTTILDIGLLQLLVWLPVSMVQSYFTCTKCLKKNIFFNLTGFIFISRSLWQNFMQYGIFIFCVLFFLYFLLHTKFDCSK